MVRRAAEALEALSESPVPSLLTRLDAQGDLAYGYYLDRQNAKADAAFAELTKELERTGRERTLAAADAWNNWGLVHHRGEILKAEPLYRRSLEIHRAIGGERPGSRRRPPQLRRRSPAAGALCRSGTDFPGGHPRRSRPAGHVHRDVRDDGARGHVRRDRPPRRGPRGARDPRPVLRDEGLHSLASRLPRARPAEFWPWRRGKPAEARTAVRRVGRALRRDPGQVQPRRPGARGPRARRARDGPA